MVTFFISLLLLVAGYFIYGRIVERVFSPDDRPTPALTQGDGVDFVVLPFWKTFMIQFLNIAGTGPIFGAIMGAKFGPAAYLWIVGGCIFAGATHDYLTGMLSMRNNGAGMPIVIGKYLGRGARDAMMVFCTILLIMVGVVFVYSPAVILSELWGTSTFWVIAIFAYYLVATLLPVDKVIGKIYPVFAFSLLFMALALFVVLCFKMPEIPELWDGVESYLPGDNGSIFPYLFITIACGAISGFHATQSPLMARCMKSERQGRPIFFGAMITEGIVALIWATVASYFFYGKPTPGYELIEAAHKSGFATSAPMVVHIVCNEWLGAVGALLALLGVVAAPITSGDTALRSARLIVADMFNIKQRQFNKRLIICIPVFASAIALLFWQIENPEGFNVIWQYFGWSNQTLAVFTLWATTVYLAKRHKAFIITLIPAVFMTIVCTTFILSSPMALGILLKHGCHVGILVGCIFTLWFLLWLHRTRQAERGVEERERTLSINPPQTNTMKKGKKVVNVD